LRNERTRLLKTITMDQIEITINYEGINMLVVGDYTKAEEAVMYDKDMSGHPGSSAEFEVQQVLVEGNDITSIISENHFELIAQEVLRVKDNE
jgi:hypothetical protein